MLGLAAAGFPRFVSGRTQTRPLMDKREFLKTSGAIVAGSVFSELVPGQEPETPRENWAGNLNYSTDHLHVPASVEEVQQVVTKCARLRALGTRHSFSTIADSTENQVSLSKLDSIDIDEKGARLLWGRVLPTASLRR
jgi:xylitol oxidase